MADVISIKSNDSSYGSSEYEVEKILKERTKTIYNKKLGVTSFKKEYKVKWVGYTRPTWEPESNLNNCQKLLNDFNQNKERKEKKLINKYKHPLIDLGKKKKTEYSIYSALKNNKKETKIKEEIKHDEQYENKLIEKCEAPPVRTLYDYKPEYNKNINSTENNIFNNENNKTKDNDDDSGNLITLEEFAGFDFIRKSPGIKKEKFYVEDNVEKKREKVKKKKLDIIEISSIKIPDEPNEKFKLNIKYKNRENNQITCDEFEANNRGIRKDILIKYYESIIFKFKKGENIINTMTFNTSK